MKTTSALLHASAMTLVLGLPIGTAAAEEDRGTFTFLWENDFFGRTDRDYTNGVKFSYLSGPHATDGLMRFIANDMMGADGDAVMRRGIALGQSIFTPEETRTAAPLPDQHPYAGWLYAEYTAVIEEPKQLTQFTIQAGIVGPSAGGEWVQNNYHELINGHEVLGWDNQIADEIGINFGFDRSTRTKRISGNRDLALDITPSWGGSLGNILTEAHAGVTFRLGQDLEENDYGPPRVRPSLAGAGHFDAEDGYRWYLFLGAQARLVAHNMFLDGSLFRDDDPSVHKNNLVGDFQAGAVFQFGRYQLSYTHVLRTPEFEEQNSFHQIGAVNLAVSF